MSRTRRQRGGAPNRDNPIALGSLSHVGMKRANNQDNLCALIGPNAPPGTDALLAVADGMGGHQAGEVASEIAIRGMVSRLTRKGNGQNTVLNPPQYQGFLERAVQEVNAEVRQSANHPDTRGMGTTLTAALLMGNKLMFAHVGDSRAYLLRQGRLQQITRDHSWVAEEVAKGTISPQQAKEHPNRNILTRALGIEPGVQVDSLSLVIEQGDVLLLCSDGLHSLVSDEEIARILARLAPDQASETLVKKANEMGGNDNVTVIVARFDSLPSDEQRSNMQSEMHQMTTVQMRAPSSEKAASFKILRALTAPIWFPVWLIVKLVKGPGRKDR